MSDEPDSGMPLGMKNCPLISSLDTVEGSPLEILESIPGMIRAAAHECSKSKKCINSHCNCALGYVEAFEESRVFNYHDVFNSSRFLDEVKSLVVWIFSFCPKCGCPIDRQSIADKLGKELENCNE